MSNKWLTVLGILGSATLAHGAITGARGGTAAFAGMSCSGNTCARGSTATNGVQSGARVVGKSVSGGGVQAAGGSTTKVRGVSAQGPNGTVGRTASRTTTNNGDGSLSSTKTIGSVNGAVGRTRNTSAVNNGDGSATINTSVTGKRGSSGQSFTIYKN